MVPRGTYPQQKGPLLSEPFCDLLWPFKRTHGNLAQGVETNCHRAVTYTVTVCSPGFTGVGSACATFPRAIAMSYIGRGGTVGPWVDISSRLPSDPPAARAIASASA